MQIAPFKAFRFDKVKVGNAGDCLAPPYDIIDPTKQQYLYEKNQYNIVRIIKGEITNTDNQDNNQYTRAAGYLNNWIEKGILKQDQQDAIYVYIQDYQFGDSSIRRFSFIALAKLEEFGTVVKPHEQILNKPIIDRLNLTRATSAQFGLVFMLYEDKQKVTDNLIENSVTSGILAELVDQEGIRHRLYSITAKDQIKKIVEMMRDKSCIIADGHHRYTTGLNYSKENTNPKAKYQMIAFANTTHKGLIVLATHRLVSDLGDFTPEKLIAGLKKNFKVTEYKFDSPQGKIQSKQKSLASMKSEHAEDENAFCFYCGEGVFYTAVLKDKNMMDKAAPDKSPPWKSLDVSVLHKLILEKILGLNEDKQARGDFIEYVKDTPNAIDESVAKVDKGQKQVAFFVNPPMIKQIQMVADNGERMPQKSTYFYPKIFTGFTINKL